MAEPSFYSMRVQRISRALGRGTVWGWGRASQGHRAYGAHKRTMEYQKPIQENKRLSPRRKKKYQ